MPLCVNNEMMKIERWRSRLEEKTLHFIFSLSQMADDPPLPTARPPLEEEAIEPEDWDLIVLGSGLAECLVAR